MNETSRLRPLAAAACLILLAAGCSPPAVPADVEDSPAPPPEFELVDLTHPFNEETVYWPTAPHGFRLDTLAHGWTEGGFFYSAFQIAAPEHGGTHLDAPLHFARDGHATDEIPLERLFAPAVVIDISDTASVDHDYRLTAEDVRRFEDRHGVIPRGSVVLLRTGWSRHWPDARRYLGGDPEGDGTDLNFPSFGIEAARHLVEQREVAALGVDVASLDHGRSSEFEVHRIAATANVPGFENLANLGRLPPTGAWILALPMKIQGGSGGPLRAVGVVPAVEEPDEGQ